MKVAAFAVISAVSLYAQVERASIVGTITDRSGAAVPDVQVMVVHEGTNTTMMVRTAESGNYSAPNLAPGSYTITAEKPGFSRAVIRTFVVQTGQAARLEGMTPAAVSLLLVHMKKSRTRGRDAARQITSTPPRALPRHGVAARRAARGNPAAGAPPAPRSGAHARAIAGGTARGPPRTGTLPAGPAPGAATT